MRRAVVIRKVSNREIDQHSNYFEDGRHLKAWWTTADVVHPTFHLVFCWVENSIPFYTFTIQNFNIVSSWSVNHPSQSHEHCLYSIPITCTKPIRTSLHLCCWWTFIQYTCTPPILTSLHMKQIQFCWYQNSTFLNFGFQISPKKLYILFWIISKHSAYSVSKKKKFEVHLW
jgi:hypothetical protein